MRLTLPRLSPSILYRPGGRLAKVCFGGDPCFVLLGRYEKSGNPAIELVHTETTKWVASVTVNMSCIHHHDELFVKDYAENSGMMKLMEDAGLLVDTGRRTRSGFVELIVAQMTPHVVTQWNDFKKKVCNE